MQILALTKENFDTFRRASLCHAIHKTERVFNICQNCKPHINEWMCASSWRLSGDNFVCDNKSSDTNIFVLNLSLEILPKWNRWHYWWLWKLPNLPRQEYLHTSMMMANMTMTTIANMMINMTFMMMMMMMMIGQLLTQAKIIIKLSA